MFNGLVELSVLGYVAVALVLTHVTILSVTIYLHRHLTHRALDLHPAVQHFFRFWVWLTTGMIGREWAAIHRKHHAKCETEDDPHSPQQVGINRVLWAGVLLYRDESNNRETIERYGHGAPDDWLERNVYTRHNFLGIGLMLVADVVLFGLVAGPLIWATQMLWIPFWAAGVINGLGHYFGYRNYECPDASTNLVPIGILIGGEEMHNNHHAFASSAKFSSRWWELDIGWMYIRILETLGLARVKKVAPRPIIEQGKATIDLDTLRAVITNRFQVLTRYGKDVVVPVIQDEIRRADDSCRQLFKRARAALVRDDSLVDEAGRREVETALSLSEQLKTVYQFRQRLQALWKRSSATHEMLLQSLQDWISEAEATGIRALEDFAHSLRGYTLSTPAA
jgi:stearoyl-CoA desaturase (delta-9 desaturase)